MTFISSTRQSALRRSSILATLSSYYGVWQQRRILKSLSDTALDDIGVTRAQAVTEARRPFWDAPEIWRC
jgi:uncharacterized protein YjiS (DUF1127 family)